MTDLMMYGKPQFSGGWVRLGTCFPYIKNGMNVKQQKEKLGIPITRIETLSSNRFNRDKVGYAGIFSTEGIEDRVLADGDILMSHINSLPYLGRAVMYEQQGDERMIHGMNLLRLKADRSVVRPDYATAYFRSGHFRRQIIRIANKSVNQASFSVRNLKELSFPLVSLDMQKDIVERLNVVDGEINTLQQMLFGLDSLVKSRFNEMLDGADDGLISLGELAQSKMTPARKVYSDNDIIKYIDIGSIDNTAHLVLDCQPFRMGEAPSRAQQCVRQGDLLVSTVRPKLKNIALIDSAEDCLVASSGFCVLRSQNCPSEYLRAVVCDDRFTDEMCRLTTGANYPAIKAADVLGFKTPELSMDDMSEFSAFVRRVDKLRFKLLANPLPAYVCRSFCCSTKSGNGGVILDV